MSLAALAAGSLRGAPATLPASSASSRVASRCGDRARRHAGRRRRRAPRRAAASDERARHGMSFAIDTSPVTHERRFGAKSDPWRARSSRELGGVGGAQEGIGRAFGARSWSARVGSPALAHRLDRGQPLGDRRIVGIGVRRRSARWPAYIRARNRRASRRAAAPSRCERGEHLLRRAFEQPAAAHREHRVADERDPGVAEDEGDVAERVAGDLPHFADMVAEADRVAFVQRDVDRGDLARPRRRAPTASRRSRRRPRWLPPV